MKDTDGVIFEFVQVGSYVKVSAVDTTSLVEVSIVGAPSAGEAALRAAALRKLKNKLAEKKSPKKLPSRPGLYV